MNWAGIGAGALCLAVMLGAFGAHGLRDRLDAYSLSVYERAVFYHFIHALGLVITPLFVRAGMLSKAAGNRIAWLLLIGIVLFSGSLYVLAISGWYLLRQRHLEFAKRSATVAVSFGLAAALSVVVLGDESGYTATHNQKMKIAAMESM